jgi:hypothetical protein
VRLALALALLAACQRAPQSDAAPVASTNVAAVSATASAAPAPSRAWFEGPWNGRFQSELLRIEPAAGSVKEWKLDDGKHASGPGTLKLLVSADGTVQGSASGALGELVVSGRADVDRVALTLTGAEPDGFHGVVLAAQTPEGMQGTLNASSADSLQVRQAKVALTRAAP